LLQVALDIVISALQQVVWGLNGFLMRAHARGICTCPLQGAGAEFAFDNNSSHTLALQRELYHDYPYLAVLDLVQNSFFGTLNRTLNSSYSLPGYIAAQSNEPSA
jgi:hypothetical protein